MLQLCLGSGREIMEGFIHVDRRNMRRPTEETLFLRADVRDLKRYFRPGSITTIVAHDLLEHFPVADSRPLLSSWVDLLESGGKIEIRTPDLERLAAWILQSNEDPDTMARRVYGDQDFKQNFHMTGFTEAWFYDAFDEVGVEVMQVEHDDYGTNITVSGRKK